MGFYCRLSDSKSPQVSRTLLSILAVFNNAVVWMVSTRPPTCKSSRSFSYRAKSSNHNWYNCHFPVPQFFQFSSKFEILIIIIIIIVHSLELFTSALPMVFHWSLRDNKSPQFSRTLLSILVVLNNVVVWMVSTRPLTSKTSSPFTKLLVTVPNAPITISIIVTRMFHCFSVP